MHELSTTSAGELQIRGIPKFPFLKEMTDYNFTAVENISKTTFLELAQGGYLSRAENLILVGNPGLGKTYYLGNAVMLLFCPAARRKA